MTHALSELVVIGCGAMVIGGDDVGGGEVALTGGELDEVLAVGPTGCDATEGDATAGRYHVGHGVELDGGQRGRAERGGVGRPSGEEGAAWDGRAGGRSAKVARERDAGG